MTHRNLTLDQQRAKHSLQIVRGIRGKMGQDPDLKQRADDYASYVVRLPADILMNGLGQALAQLQAAAKGKKEDPHYWLYQDLQNWLCRADPLAPYPPQEDHANHAIKKENDLLEAIISNNRRQYQQALSEAMAWLKWHTKITVAQLKKTEDGD